jgi:flagellar biosynthesis/type III secretory pathway M-ring protein FliF/YscJ
MKHYKKTYGAFSILAAAVMVITLVWLTVSTPFIYAAEQQQEAYSQANNTDDESSESDESPLGNNTEEKTETNSNTLSEYLHHIDELSQPATPLHRHNSSHDVAVYVAFHGETLCPPPNPIFS